MAPKLGTDHIKETLQQEGERATSEIADRAAAEDIETTTSIREGAPADTITSYAETSTQMLSLWAPTAEPAWIDSYWAVSPNALFRRAICR